jgi:hypothetical protein
VFKHGNDLVQNLETNLGISIDGGGNNAKETSSTKSEEPIIVILTSGEEDSSANNDNSSEKKTIFGYVVTRNMFLRDLFEACIL